MNLTILPEAATDDAKEIDKIIAEINEEMQILNTAIKNNIPEHLETVWSNELLDEWNHWYNDDLQNSMQGMQLSSENLRKAVDAALEYSQGR